MKVAKITLRAPDGVKGEWVVIYQNQKQWKKYLNQFEIGIKFENEATLVDLREYPKDEVVKFGTVPSKVEGKVMLLS